MKASRREELVEELPSLRVLANLAIELRNRAVLLQKPSMLEGVIAELAIVALWLGVVPVEPR
jgi:hypothetical protein